MARRAQAMLDAQRLAAHVELVKPRRLALLAGETVGELAAVVGQQSGDFHRRRRVQPPQEVHAAGVALIGVDVHEYPARGPVDGDEQVAPGGFVRHLRQVLDVHVQEARFIVLEGLGWHLAFTRIHTRLGLQGAQVGHTVATQTPIQPGAGRLRVDEFPHHHQQVIQQQQGHAPQLHRQGLLCRRHRGAQLVRTMRQVVRRLAASPLGRRGPADVVALGQLNQWRRRGPDLGTRAGGRAGLGVDLAHWALSALKVSITPRITSLALNSGQLRRGEMITWDATLTDNGLFASSARLSTWEPQRRSHHPLRDRENLSEIVKSLARA